jgi:hypothetical protein
MATIHVNLRFGSLLHRQALARFSLGVVQVRHADASERPGDGVAAGPLGSPVLQPIAKFHVSYWVGNASGL